MSNTSRWSGLVMGRCGEPILGVVVVFLVINGWWCCSVSGCWERERTALLKLKASINYPNGNYLPHWVDEETANCCEWYRVKCNSTGRVIKLNLSYMRDDFSSGDWWYFNASLLLPFEELRSLHLRSNSLVGWIEDEGPGSLSRLNNLEELHLSHNYFDNSILSALSGLSTLKFLNLSRNNLEGSTHLNGSERLSRLNNLEVLDLSDNHLNNSIQSFLELDDLVSLKKLVLSDNSLTSFEPIKDFRKILSMSNLEVLDLAYNSFNNSVLSYLNGLSSLKSLHLQRNLLEGSIQIEGTLTNLEELDISDNRIVNLVIPEGIKSSSKLKVLVLQDANYNASKLLQSLRAFNSLKTLHLEGDSFEGTINTHDLQNLNNLEELFLDESSIDKKFLQSVGVMTSLKVLSMTYCGLNGSIPIEGLCELKNLQELYIDDNEFEGTVPSCLGNLKSLQLIDLSYNRFVGNIASSPLASLTRLEYLLISNNHFQVPISFRAFYNHSKLKVILGDNNKLMVEPMFHNWAPMFQLTVFVLSNCSANEHGVAIAPPSFLYSQYDLKIVDLSHNNFSGAFPTWLLENNTGLEALFLRDNSFTGPFQLPSHTNPNIVEIDISDNNIHDRIPANISSIFPNLGSLNMSRNGFQGNIFSFSGMNSLWGLDLSNNFLSGVILDHFAMRCPSLTFLKLSNNNLSGQISPIISNLTKLEFFYLNGNKFWGKMPHNLVTIALRVFDVSDNNLSGKLPRWNMTSIMEISMYKNHFQGPIPLEFCKFDELEFLDLSENNLSGSVPSCFNSSRITHVLLSKNGLEGPITRAFYSSSSLVALDLRENYFSGSIPESIDNLFELSVLLLKGNHFKGEIPTQLCNLRKLSILVLSHNYLSGPIPSCLSNITFEANYEISVPQHSFFGMGTWNDSLASIRATKSQQSKNWFDAYPVMDVQVEVEFTTKSSYHSYKGYILNAMSGIDLSCNQLTGKIPPEIGFLSNIRALNLSHNNLTGSIPSTFSNLRQTESLDLSYNNLNGKIPSQLVELNSLEVFSVAHNNLSGTTPDRKAQFGTFEENSYEGNAHLCGPPLPAKCSGLRPPSPVPNASDNDTEEDSGFIDMGVFYLSFVASYTIMLLGVVVVLYINPYWRRTWFYYVEICMTTSYYFLLDNFHKLFKCGNM